MSNETKYQPLSEFYRCKNCGSSLHFDPDSGKLNCSFCDSNFEIDLSKIEIEDYDFDEVKHRIKKTEFLESIHYIQCSSCGVQTQFDPQVISDICTFCTSPLNLKDTHSRQFSKPDCILPFKINHQIANQKFASWIKSRWLLPNDLITSLKKNKELTGIYIPFWIYSAETFSKYEGIRYDGNDENRTKKKVSGEISEKFNRMDILASNSLSKTQVDELEPWDTENFLPFDNRFLLGFKTECYSRDMKLGYEDAIKKIKLSLEKVVKEKIGGSDQDITKMNTQINDVKFLYSLMPIWVSSYEYNKKIYRFVINARSGEVQGERPISRIKMFFLMSLIVLSCIYIISFWLFANLEGKIFGVISGLILLGYLIIIYFRAHDDDLKSNKANPYNK